jgi:steroid 5-alpha reductase family enzyme
MFKIKSKITSLLIVLAVYILAFLGAYFTVQKLAYSETMITVLIADVVATIIVFIFSIIFKNSSIYDPYWSVIPPVIVIYLIQLFPEGNQIRQWIILVLVLFWSLRLTINWMRGWTGLQHQDWRYTNIAEKTGVFYWPVSFLGIHLMPTIFVFLGCLPLWFTLASSEPLNIYDFFAVAFTVAAVMVEWQADEQLIKFKKSNSRESFIQTGLWGISRHPNYLGEISFWVGMFFFLLSSADSIGTTGIWTGAGFISMIILFQFISIPMMEKRNKINKPGYQEYIDKVPALFPHPFKRKL